MKDSSYSTKGAFPIFLTQTNEKKVTIKYILSAIKKKYQLKGYTHFVFTDIGAGEGTITLPIIKLLRKSVKLDSFCIEPSSLIEILREKCGPNIHYIKKGMEEIDFPKSDLILMAHSLNYVTNKKEFAKKIKNSLNPRGKLLVVGTHPESDDLNFKRELTPKPKYDEMLKENIFEYLEQMGFKVTREYANSFINLENALRLNKKGQAVISFYYHKPFSEITPDEISRFKELARKFAPRNKLIKTLQFIWVE